MLEQNEQQATIEKMHADVSRIYAEISRIYAEQRKLNAETHKITRENFWYPMGVAMAVVATISSITAMAIKLFL
ncbi:hypothetical protein HX875_25925 [Pseudomonas yamanorum]|jgi:hypothetical protein|uniref:Uncharacterized protein n=1 Tax=Pseudomonas yamanorum TaxID=515393 RepID=A0A7Y8EF22_9PSED|nr:MULTISPECIES: hypothetical protein [Pseudomonas]NWD22214.1 hypothetical protein [Pseudomonas yamanorum]NWE13493.1 hypothetical protein [Pseudomonas yamanorum]NWE42937.1 hypothetical protein [Pseudomonas yamanorum]NWE77423.1 hypothetical protein [Pseudomonas yamanorum]